MKWIGASYKHLSYLNNPLIANPASPLFFWLTSLLFFDSQGRAFASKQLLSMHTHVSNLFGSVFNSLIQGHLLLSTEGICMWKSNMEVIQSQNFSFSPKSNLKIYFSLTLWYICYIEINLRISGVLGILKLELVVSWPETGACLCKRLQTVAWFRWYGNSMRWAMLGLPLNLGFAEQMIIQILAWAILPFSCPWDIPPMVAQPIQCPLLGTALLSCKTVSLDIHPKRMACSQPLLC